MKHIHILTYISYGRLLDPTIPLTHLHFVNCLCYQIGHFTFYSSWKSLNFKISQIRRCSLYISTIFVLKVFSHFSSLWFLRVLFHVVTSSHFYWTPQKPQNPQNPQKTWHTTRSPTSLAGRRSPTDAGLESSTHTGGGRRLDLHHKTRRPSTRRIHRPVREKMGSLMAKIQWSPKTWFMQLLNNTAFAVIFGAKRCLFKHVSPSSSLFVLYLCKSPGQIWYIWHHWYYLQRISMSESCCCSIV